MKRIVDALGKMNRGKRDCAVLVLCAMTTMALPAQTVTTLFRFDGSDGSAPNALIQGTDGNLYGTAGYGAMNNTFGTVFKITPSGTLTTLYVFCTDFPVCADGGNPFAGLVQATNGSFYGTTYSGGAYGQGTVFKITPSGALTTLYSFCPQTGCIDGADPAAALVQATNGYLYGTAQSGGANNFGTVFRITPGGTLTTLYSFCAQSGCTDGAQPDAGLVQATNGNLYGITAGGGANGYGTVFKITPSGTLTGLHSFCSQNGCRDGAQPSGGLVQATNGSFYGTTPKGGAHGYGTVFRITPSGALATLHSFCAEAGCADGANPSAGLIQATDGDFYGTASTGGANGYGTVFRITPSGALTTLYSFCSQSACTDGEYPVTGLVQDTNGELYGTTSGGGANLYHGTVFSLSLGLGPFVETQPTSGKVGAAVKILGTNLTGATSVTFNGGAAVFKVVSSSEIATIVPTGATTGTVQVVTPSGTLSSNVAFRVP